MGEPAGASDCTPAGLSGGGYALAFVAHDLDDGSAFLNSALALNPNLALAWHCSGWTKAFLGEPETAIEQLTHTMRLSPRDPLSFRAQGGVAFAHFLAGRYDEAALWAERALRMRPTPLPALRDLAAANALAGRLSEASATMAHVRQLAPSLRAADVRDWIPFRRSEDLARMEDGLRKAGLPE